MSEPRDAVERVSIPGVARVRLIAAFVGATALLSGAAFVAGTFVRAPSSVLDESAGDFVPVFVEAEMRTVDEGLVIQAMTQPGPRTTISGVAISEFPKAVVTSVNVEVGQEVPNGLLLGAVSNRPAFALALALPLYRDIAYRDTGPDVVSLQAALGVPQTGQFDWTTRRAFARLYSDKGYSPPGGSSAYVRAAEVVSIGEGNQARVLEVASFGDELAAERPLLVLETGPVRVAFRANATEVDQLALGQEVTVRISGETLAGVVGSIGAFSVGSAEGSGGSTNPGYDITVDLMESPQGVEAGVSAIVTTSTEQVETQLAVPSAAIRTTQGDTFVWLKSGDEEVQVPVVVVAQANGWVAVETQELTAGDEVRVWP